MDHLLDWEYVQGHCKRRGPAVACQSVEPGLGQRLGMSLWRGEVARRDRPACRPDNVGGAASTAQCHADRRPPFIAGRRRLRGRLHDGTNVVENGKPVARVCQRDQSASARFIAPAKTFSRLAATCPTMNRLCRWAPRSARRLAESFPRHRQGCRHVAENADFTGIFSVGGAEGI